MVKLITSFVKNSDNTCLTTDSKNAFLSDMLALYTDLSLKSANPQKGRIQP